MIAFNRMTMSFARILIAIGIAAAPGLGHAQVQNQIETRHEVIRGRVTTDSGRVMPDVEVIITRAPDRAFKSTTSGPDGGYEIDWTEGTGDYLVHFAAPGYQRFVKRVTRVAAESVFVVDARLGRQTSTEQLATVVTQGQRAVPSREPPRGPDVGAAEALAPASGDHLPPDRLGDLNAMAGFIPGIVSSTSGFSTLGLGPSQNSVTLNGMTFPGAQLPRDVTARVRVSTSSYDPANGWFSGAHLNVQLAPGDLFSSRVMHYMLDAPTLQSNDPIARGLGQRYTNFNGSIGGDGQLVEDRFAYSYGLQGGRRAADVSSLVTADAALLEHAGVAPDSAARVLRFLQQSQIPVTAGSGSSATNENLVFLGRLDHAPYDWKTMKQAKTTWGATGYLNWTRDQAQSLQPTMTPAHAGEREQRIGMVEGEYSTLLNGVYLATLRSGFNYSRQQTRPYLDLPDGEVLVSSAFADGSTAISTIFFGGNSSLRTDTRAWTWESNGELQLYPPGYSTHRVKITLDSRLDGYAQDLGGNKLGTFSFASPADLAANNPTWFTRILNAPRRSGGEWNGFVSIGDLWRAGQNLQILYGARLEENVFRDLPAFNPAIRSAFGLRTDRAPNALATLPRFGFSWNLPGPGSSAGGTLRGGFGAFRNWLDPMLLSTAAVSTGLPNGLVRLACVGAGVPIPNWLAYVSDRSSIPERCANGAPPTFVDSTPNIQVFDRHFQPQESWRGNLAWSSSWHRTVYSVDGVYSLNTHQPGTVDLNFLDAPVFFLPDDDRPVYVNPGSIVQSSGAVSPVDARPHGAFGRVISNVSDLRSVSRQATVTVRPPLVNLPNGSIVGEWWLAYTLSSVRAQQRGFNGSTFGSPELREWARGDLDIRHQFVGQVLYLPFGPQRGIALIVSAHIQSGIPFTPSISSDVNGDGLANDRAFIHDPNGTPDTAIANGMAALLRSAPHSVRDCLTRQAGFVAARNSCRGPWSAWMNANLILGRGRRVPFLPFINQRTSVMLNATNILGGIDQLLHGSSALRGWGTQPVADPTLYITKGFDSTSRRFLYQVNPRFGTTSPSFSTLRAPFRLTLDVSIDIGRPQTEQELDRWLRDGRSARGGEKIAADELKRRFERNVPDPYAQLLDQTDSLLLTRDQVNALQDIEARYRGKMDSIWVTLSERLATLPDRYDMATEYKHADGVIDDAWELTRVDVRDQLPKILNPTQLSILGGPAGRFYVTPFRMHIRSYRY